jgi:ATP-binding cassette subfamily F protein uup
MPLVSLRDLVIRFRGPELLDGVSCEIEAGERIGLLGRNGAGKTTLLRMLAGEQQPDSGEISFAPGSRVAYLPQDVPSDISGAVHDVALTGARAASEEPDWQIEERVEQTLARMQLDGAARFESLSSGMKRRVLLARALASNPDLLLLDEPTNHLDVDAIVWLEDFLSRWSGTLLFITHDRMFLRKLAARILEIDRGRLFDWSCDYDTFLVRKEQALAAEEKQNALFDKRLAQEEVWIRQGIKARRTRNEGRVRALKAMRLERGQRRERGGKVKLEIQEAQRSGALVAEVENITFSYGERKIVDCFSTTIMRGDKVGIIGSNGAGKTTLLRLLLGKLEPQSGRVRLGTNLQIAYFDQLREQLRDEATVAENVGDGYDTVASGDGRRHIIGYLQDFLFTPERARSPVRFLSGGERNRVLLAKLFAKPANVLVLDEPTNDLDADTLELLEEQLIDFSGTVLLVSHDRAFLNNVVTSTIAFEPDASGQLNVREYVGGYDDWIRQRPKSETAAKSKAAEQPKPKTPLPPIEPPKRRLSYKEQQELKSLPGEVEKLEAAIAELHEQMAAPDFYKQGGEKIATAQAKLKELEAEFEQKFERWHLLEAGES